MITNVEKQQCKLREHFGKQGWRSSESTRPDSLPRLGVICGLSLLLVLVLAPRGFSSSTPVFLSPQKPTLLNSNSIWKVLPVSTLRQIH